MNLEINKKHIKANLSKLKERNRISSAIMSTVLAISLFSGCSKQVDNINNKVPQILFSLSQIRAKMKTKMQTIGERTKGKDDINVSLHSNE